MTIINCRYGDFSVPEREDLIFDALREYGEWAQEEIEMLGGFLHPGDTVLDIGAFIGTHARAFSQMVGSQGAIHAFEPNKHIYFELLKNAQIAPQSNIKTYQMALGGRKQSRFILQDDIHSNLGASQLYEGSPDVAASVLQVQPLDDLEFSSIDLIKVDVEGMEYDFIVGGMRAIRQHMPVMFLEANSLQAAGKIIDLAQGINYVVFGYISRAFNPDNFNRSTVNIFGEARECGLLLIHRDQIGIWQDTLSSLKLPMIQTIDQLSLLLLHKPQYVHEVLSDVEAFREGAYRLVHSNLYELEKLNEQLIAMEAAKANAEHLAYKRLSELEQLNEQLIEMEAAKANAEELAISRYSELNILQFQKQSLEHEIQKNVSEIDKKNMHIARIYNSKAYKLLAALRLAPKKDAGDV